MSEYEEVFEANSVLEGNRITLRPFSEGDIGDILEYAKDEEVTRYLTWESFKDLETAKEVVKKFYLSRPGIYAIELKEEKKCIGCIDIRVHNEHNKASFGYVLNRAYWNRGLMTEALRRILELSFNKIRLNRVEATHYVGNEGSGRVMQKCGMKYEGIARQEQYIKGKFVDVVHYGILKSDYEKEKESKEK